MELSAKSRIAILDIQVSAAAHAPTATAQPLNSSGLRLVAAPRNIPSAAGLLLAGRTGSELGNRVSLAHGVRRDSAPALSRDVTASETKQGKPVSTALRHQLFAWIRTIALSCYACDRAEYELRKSIALYEIVRNQSILRERARIARRRA